MLVNGTHYRTIWANAEARAVEIIDQTLLPATFQIATLRNLDDACRAIFTMQVRGAPLIGIAAAYGIALAARSDASDAAIDRARAALLETRPTAVNLRWALDQMHTRLANVPVESRASRALQIAAELADADVAACRAIGDHGAALLEALWIERGRPSPLHVMTHCNAGWLATVDYGTALAPIYALHDRGIPIHVWVSETRPRNQGLLTEWELRQHGVPHTFIVDNAAGHYLAQGAVHAVIVGSDRTTANGDVCNKIGTYLKALAAHEANVPFYAAVPTSTIDMTLATGAAIPIEERATTEVTTASEIPVKNPGFDVTPAKFVTAIVTECGAVAPGDIATLSH